MSGSIFRISVGFLVGVLALLALSLCLSDYYAGEQQRLFAAGDAQGAEEASQALREAIERDPNNYFPYLLLGGVQVAMDDPDAAVESYRDVLELNPNATSASVYMAQALLEQAKMQEAKQEYLKLEKEGRISD